MKNFFLICLVLSLFFSCSKENNVLDLNEIVQTDSEGNPINNSKSQDWKIQNYIENSQYVNLKGGFETLFKVIHKDTIILKNDCKIDSIKILLYPNPMGINNFSKLVIKSPIFIKSFYYTYHKHNESNAIGSVSGYVNSKEVNINILKEDFIGYGSDFDLYFVIVDNNNCAYYFNGKLKI